MGRTVVPGSPKHSRSSVSGKTPTERGLNLLGGAALTLTLLSQTAQNGDRNMSFTREEMLIQGEVARAVRYLVHIEGINLAAVLATAHAEIIGCIAAVYGGDVAAYCARQAEERVQHLPQVQPVVVAMAAPGRGRAH